MNSSLQFTLAILLIVWPVALVVAVCEREPQDSNETLLAQASGLTLLILAFAWGIRLAVGLL